jgi:2-aminoethylphosphonate-pyruvate transaminase
MLLLIPGPVSTRPEVKAAMGQDFAPWDQGFRPLYAAVRERVGALAGDVLDTHAVLPLQGCGHFAVEAAIRSLIPPGGKLLIPITGSYAERMARLAREAGRVVVELAASPVEPVSPDSVGRALAADPGIGHVGLVYSETSSGVVHDPVAIGRVAREAGRRVLLDAVSAFGALPLDLSEHPEIDAAVFTANKCLEGMPGLSFVVARIDRIRAGRGWAGSWSFDLCDILETAARDGWGSFRFTPPAQVLAAVRVALELHAAEGGRAARLARYTANARTLYDGMRAIGLTPYLRWDVQGPIVVNVHAPHDPAWSLQGFVDALKARGFLISNFFNTALPSFRVGCIGAITPDDMRRFVGAADSALGALGVRQRAPLRRAA